MKAVYVKEPGSLNIAEFPVPSAVRGRAASGPRLPIVNTMAQKIIGQLFLLSLLFFYFPAFWLLSLNFWPELFTFPVLLLFP